MQLTDKFGRKISYLRLAVTDRCNLRCQYCMPAHGIDIVDRKELLSYKEMYRITRVLSELGVNKVRLTGGEPFVRKDFIGFLEMLSYNDLLDAINITTNGALISKYITDIEKLEKLAIESERYTLTDQVFYLHTPDGFGRSKLAAKVESCLGVSATARNLNTINNI